MNDPRLDSSSCSSFADAPTKTGSQVWGPQGGGAKDSGGYDVSWDRGHLSPSYATSHDKDGGWQTTYFTTNIAPQGASFNQHFWRILEEHISDYTVANRRDLRVVVGVLYDFRRIEKIDGTWIPHYWYSAVCDENAGTGFAYVLANVNRKYDPYPDGAGLVSTISLAELDRDWLGRTEFGAVLGSSPSAGGSMPAPCYANGILDLGDKTAMDSASDPKRGVGCDGTSGTVWSHGTGLIIIPQKSLKSCRNETSHVPSQCPVHRLELPFITRTNM